MMVDRTRSTIAADHPSNEGMPRIFEIASELSKDLAISVLSQAGKVKRVEDEVHEETNGGRPRKRRRLSGTPPRELSKSAVKLCDFCLHLAFDGEDDRRKLLKHDGFETDDFEVVLGQPGKKTSKKSRQRPRYNIVLPTGEGLRALVSVLDSDSTQLMRAFAFTRNTVDHLSAEYGACTADQSLSISDGQVRLSLRIAIEPKLKWTVNSLKLGLKPLFRSLLETLASDGGTGPATATDFFQVVKPPDTEPIGDCPGLKSQLMNYQKRTASWMVQRERGAPVNSNSWATALHDDGSVYMIQPEQGLVARPGDAIHETTDYIRGGLLSDEMGLGKTVEVLATLLEHPREDASTSLVLDAWTGAYVQPSKATLIITPSTILRQWLEEVVKHTHLKAYHYDGTTKHREDVDIDSYDIVITSYAALTADIHVVRAQQSSRSMRNEPRYEKRQSPLLGRQWWRVVMDEVQMVQSGTSSASEVASTIARVNSWAVTGTPISQSCISLFGILHFLHVRPFYGNPQLWAALVNGEHGAERVANIFGPITSRNTKSHVAAELDLPTQRRYAIPIQFSAIEESNFQDLLVEAFRDIDLDDEGQPIEGNFDSLSERQISKMLHHITVLRQACTHPQVGITARTRFGQNARVQALSDVLQLMRDATSSTLEVDRRALNSAQITRGQIYEYTRQPEKALSVFERAVVEAKRRILAAEERISSYRSKRRRQAIDVDEKDDRNVQDWQLDTRHWKELLHRSLFFTASIHFQLKDEDKETALYAEAKAVRQSLLREREAAVVEVRAEVADKQARQAFVVIPEMHFPKNVGLTARVTLEHLQELTEQMNEQANELDEFRNKCILRLTSKLADENEDPSGEEYQQSLDAQEEAFLYLELCKIMINDRCRMIDHRLFTSLMRDDARKWTESERQKAGLTMVDGMRIRDRHRPLPDPEDMSQHGNVCPALGCLKDIRDELVVREREIRQRGDTMRIERASLVNAIRDVDETLAAQRKAYEGLRQEEIELRRLYNARLTYYRQFQDLSDAVQGFSVLRTGIEHDDLDRATRRHLAEIEVEEADISDDERHARVDRTLQRLEFDIEELTTTVDRGQARLTYLNHLSDTSKSVETCIICQSDFVTGALTFCGHIYCKDCFIHWYRAHGNCPVCKKKLQRNQFYEISLGSMVKKETAYEASASSGLAGYLRLAEGEVDAIETHALRQAYSSKVDSVVKHILTFYAGTKSILYSNFADALPFFAQALAENGIGVVVLAGGAGLRGVNSVSRFLDDRKTEVMLMSGKSQAAGLNLVNATNLFLVEPLVNPAIEQQIKGRLHRIGQMKETNVYQYYVQGTVEEAILRGNVERAKYEAGNDIEPVKGTASDGAVEPKIEDVPDTIGTPIAPGLVGGKSKMGEVIERDDAIRLFRSNLGRKARIFGTELPVTHP